MDAVVTKPTDRWQEIPWKAVERNVFKLQKRIYQAEQRGDVKQVRKLQRLLLHARSAKLLAVRKVTQDNQGKKTAGVDNIKSLTPPQRLTLASNLKLEGQADPVRRIYIPKAGSDEQRPLGIPTMRDRAAQSLVKLVLEPQWEAKCEPNSYGFRPGRSTWDAIGAIYVAINQKPKYVLDADIAKCFDRINHPALLAKLKTSPMLRRQIKAWLAAGLLDEGELFPTERGTPQGGPLSPLLANVALHGLEESILAALPGSKPPIIIRYADDLVVLHPEREVIVKCQTLISEQLAGMGLELKPSKTRLTHTLEVEAGVPGFDFLGFNIRQYPAKQTRLGFKTIITPSAKARARQRRQIVEVLDRNKSAPQEKLIRELNPVISGWANYFSTVCSKETFGQLDAQLLNQLRAWIRFRSKRKSLKQGYQKYFRREDEVLRFGPKGQRLRLHFHAERPIKRHVKVVGRRSPYEADWVYWSARTGKRPGVTTRVAKLLKQQKGRCRRCGLCFKAGDKLEVDHILPKACGGKDSYANWQLLHRHCHAVKTAADRRRGVRDKHRTIEEPCAAKVASTVLKQRRGERSPRLL